MSSLFGLSSRLFAFALFVTSSQAALLDWAPQTSGTTQHLREVWGADSSNVWAVGNTGTILKYNGTAWSAQTSGTTANLLGVWGTSATNVWAVGSGGTILKWNGTAWSAQTSGTTKDLFAIWGVDANNVWAVGGTPQFGSGNVILKWNGTSWSAQTPGVSDVLTSVWGTDSSNVWAVGWNGRILKWNGTAWATQTSGSSDNFQAVWAANATNLWAVNDNGGIFKGNGSTWSAQTSSTALPLLGVRGSSTTDIRVVGADSAIFKSADGSTWSTEATTASTGFHGVWAADDTHYWAVGFDGAIYAATVAANTNLYSLSVRYFGTSKNLISFNAATTSYSVTVNQELISFAASVDAEGAATQQYQFNGGAYTSFVSGGPLVYKLLQLGANTLNVRVTNGASQKTYTININYAPPAPTLTDVSPAMGSTAGGTSVTLTGTDFTAATGVTFGGTAATDFTVDSATAITATTPPHAAGAVSVVVTTPSGSNTANTLFTYAIANLAPTDITLSSTSIAENNAAGATVGTLTATDPDVGQTQTFSLVAGSGDTDNASFTIAGNALKLTPVADFETKASYALRIRATDNGSPPMSFEKAFTVTITDVNEAPTISVIADQTTLEDTATGAIAFTIGDPDGLTGLTVSATSSDTTLIPQANIVLGGTGASRTITLTPAADANGSADITVQVSDGMLTTSKTFSLAVTPVNDAPSFALPAEQLAGPVWTARDANRIWKSITSSADGTKLAAVVDRGQIYTSTDSGVTWTARDSNRIWASITSSADGSKLAAVVYGGQIYTSTDSGVTWTARESNRTWFSISSSADGSQLAAVVFGGQIYTSTDSGVTWNGNGGDGRLLSISSSADGSKLAAVVDGDYIYTSTDSGVTWTERMTDANRYWRSITSSADGSKLAAVVNGGLIYTSTDSGVTWTERMTDANRNWVSITSSADGSKLAAVVDGGQIYTSTDSGVTWTAWESNRRWRSITSSADGNKLAAVVYGGQIYTSAAILNEFIVPAGSSEFSRAGFASSISPGPANENTQAVNFLLTTSNDALFSTPPAISSADGTLTFTPSRVAGTATVTVVAKDNGGTANGGVDTSAARTFTVTITDVNEAPTISVIADQTTLEDTATGAIAFTIGDPDGLTGLTVSATSSDTTLIPQANIVLGGTGASRTITLTPAADANGSADITVQVSDGMLTTSRTFSLAVTPVNDAPSFALPAEQLAGSLWTARESNRAWSSITSSADGSKLAAVVDRGQIYTSTDSGVTWTARDSNRRWYSITSSADGSKLAAVVFGGQIYTSTDSGVTWTERALVSNSEYQPPHNWHSIKSSADGSKLAAVVYNGQIYTSTDSGVTWTLRESNRAWRSITSSADGSQLAAVVFNGQIYTSTDSGVTWTARESNRNWWSITSSADGSKLAAVVLNGQIFTSTDSGVTWTARDTNRNWTSITSSADGSKLAAVALNGQIYTSTDSGQTWTERMNDANRLWYSITSSADGSKLAAVENGGQIYTSAAILNEFIVPAGSSEFSRAGFASSISPGPANENTQAVNFLLTTSNDALFSTPPAISSADGTLTFTPSRVAGTATVTVVAKDSGGTANGGVDTSAAQKFLIIVKDAPVINGVGFGGLTPLDATVNIDVLEGSTGSTLLVGTEAGVVQSFTRTLSGADAALFHLVDHPTIPGAFSLEFITPQDFEANPSTDANHDGVYDVTVTLTDASTPQGSGAVAFHFRLRDDNDMPSFTKGADVELAATTVPQTRTGWATAISDGDPATTQLLTFNVTKASGANILSAGPVIDPATGNLSFTPNGTAGTATFSVTLSDDSSYPSGALTTEPQTFTITTTITNQAPTISVIADQTTLEDTATGAIAFTIGDPDGLTGLTVSATSSDTTLIPQANIVLGGTGASRTITLTPAADANGSADITVQVSDGMLTTSRTFSLAVTPVNDAPSFAVQMPAAPIWSVQPTEKQKWWSVASSADGSKLAAVATLGYLYTSSDFGVTWTPHITDVKRSWLCITSSADGSKLAAAGKNGLFTSSDSGATWTVRVPLAKAYWVGITSSADGTKLAAVNSTGVYGIYTSADSGVTWTAHLSGQMQTWQSITSSADGSKLAAVVAGGQIYTSTDSGVTWTPRESNRKWQSITSSADGSKLAAVVAGGQIYTSTDSGVTWTPRESNRKWQSISSSADGSKLAAAEFASKGLIYLSVDSGATWTPQPSAGLQYNCIASSADGNRLAALSSTKYRFASYSSALSLTAGSIAVSISPFASGTPGPANESGQTLSYQVTAANPGLFTVQPSIAPNGSLTLTPGGTSGDTLLTITAADDGGTANGGKDSTTLVVPVSIATALTPSDLFSLSVGEGTLEPTFKAATRTYKTTAPSTAKSIPITPTAAFANSTITINNVAVTSGSAYNFPLIAGSGTASIKVTPLSGASKTYTVTITAEVQDATQLADAVGEVNTTAASGQNVTVSYSATINAVTDQTQQTTIGATSSSGIVTTAAFGTNDLSPVDPPVPPGTVDLTLVGYHFEMNGSDRFFQVLPGNKLTLINCTLSGGGGNSFAGDGGAILNEGELVLIDCTFTDNHTNGSGGVVENRGVLTAFGCTFSGNSAGLDGGAIDNYLFGTSTADITASTFQGNTAESGGAIVNRSAMSLTHVTIAGNTALDTAAGVWNVADISGHTPSLQLAFSILSGNGTSDLVNTGSGATVTRLGMSLVTAFSNTGTVDGGGSFSSADPRLGPLADNGGSTQTMALLTDSPAINAAIGSTAVADQRGEPIDFTVPDIGAYESTPTPFDEWRNFYFGTQDTSGNRASTADYDGDGVSNLLEFAFGTDPTGADNFPIEFVGDFSDGGYAFAGQPITKFESTQYGLDFRAVFMRIIDPASAGLVYTPQFSADLVHWQNSTVTPTVLGDDGIYELVSVPYPPFIGGKKARFFRISVSIAP